MQNPSVHSKIDRIGVLEYKRIGRNFDDVGQFEMCLSNMIDETRVG